MRVEMKEHKLVDKKNVPQAHAVVDLTETAFSQGRWMRLGWGAGSYEPCVSAVVIVLVVVGEVKIAAWLDPIWACLVVDVLIDRGEWVLLIVDNGR
ncbi:hypothetical protein CTA1_10632 [Colletotrichum tanaceti]|uniref:Uncharacterized protein n=1 Tax=Colletotrichum tanaceti TaxID=1306861 RepID=A0A4U6XLM1_9PEZI|nr:hypothetical protein CTA1_10632 [Colletotrichum tanaceti]